jgi:hypothetical protein
MSVAILAHKLNRYIGNCNDQIAQKNNFANNNNNMLDAKGNIMIHVKIGCTRNPNHYEQGVWILELINMQKQFSTD